MEAERSLRRAHKPGETDGPRVQHDGHVWRIRSLATARQVLRRRDLTTQAGFTAEAPDRWVLRRP